MTNEEAIKWFENRYNNSPMPGAKIAFRMAIEALKAQDLVNDSQCLVNDLVKRDSSDLHSACTEVVQSGKDINVLGKDTVSRQAAIDDVKKSIEHLRDMGKGRIKGFDAMLIDIKAILEQLPSAEKRTEEHTETNACDLPNLQPTCNQFATDTVSRQAAISAVNTALFPKINTAKDAEKALMALPSAEPERTGHWIHDGSQWKERWICDKCGFKLFGVRTDFCGGCGAHMMEVGHD